MKLKAQQHQRGSALLISMIIIFMLSIMGVSAMRDSTLERRMATNSIQNATAFHSAESNTDMILNDFDVLSDLIMDTNPDDVRNGIPGDKKKIVTDMLQNIGLTTEAELQFVGMGTPVGYSSNFAAYRFEVVGKSAVDAVRANSEVTQGVYIIANDN